MYIHVCVHVYICIYIYNMHMYCVHAGWEGGSERADSSRKVEGRKALQFLECKIPERRAGESARRRGERQRERNERIEAQGKDRNV